MGAPGDDDAHPRLAMSTIAQGPVYTPPAPFPGASNTTEWFHRRQLLHLQQFDAPGIIDSILDSLEIQLVIDIWRAGYMPSQPLWEMWVEKIWFDDDTWQPVVQVTIQGLRRGLPG